MVNASDHGAYYFHFIQATLLIFLSTSRIMRAFLVEEAKIVKKVIKSQNAQKIRDDMSRLSEDVDSFKHIIDGALGQAAQRCNEDVERAQERLNVLKEQLTGVALEVSRLSGGALHGRDRTKL